MNSPVKYAAWGFLFGTVGLYVLAALSLTSPIFETISAPLMYPGRWAAMAFAGPEGSNAEVVLLTIFNGVAYAVAFSVIGSVVRRPA